jgi:mannosyl-oligosaccharide alpha-1,2-mannosidase
MTGHFEHLSCFFPATLALGVQFVPTLIPYERELHDMAANALAEACWLLYKDTASGIGPEIALFEPWFTNDIESGRFMKHYENWVSAGRKRPGPMGLDVFPEPVDPKHFGSKHRDYYLYSPEYKLRPEVSRCTYCYNQNAQGSQTVETMYIMWKVTGNVIWRERAWEIFQSFEQWTRVPNGYAALVNVDKPSEAGFKDSLPR